MMIRSAAIVLLMCSMLSCGNRKESMTGASDTDHSEDLIGMNRVMLANETKKIDEYIAGNHLEMKQTGSGLRYRTSGKGDTVAGHSQRKILSIAYSLSSLEGKPTYNFPDSAPFVFRHGKAEIIQGIEEASSRMSPGDSALLVIPSHLGFGKTGDDSLVPGNTILLCRLRLLNAK